MLFNIFKTMVLGIGILLTFGGTSFCEEEFLSVETMKDFRILEDALPQQNDNHISANATVQAFGERTLSKYFDACSLAKMHATEDAFIYTRGERVCSKFGFITKFEDFQKTGIVKCELAYWRSYIKIQNFEPTRLADYSQRKEAECWYLVQEKRVILHIPFLDKLDETMVFICSKDPYKEIQYYQVGPCEIEICSLLEERSFIWLLGQDEEGMIKAFSFKIEY